MSRGPAIDWKAARVDWRRETDTQIAARLGVKRQAVSAARKRLGAPPSPAGHGGHRHGTPLQQLRAVFKALDAAQRKRVLRFACELRAGQRARKVAP
jgi:hypothetical protein